MHPVRAVTWLLVALVCLIGGQLVAQTVTNSSTAGPTNAPTAAVNEPAQETWSFSASVFGYIVPEGRDYVQPTFTWEPGWLHLEGR